MGWIRQQWFLLGLTGFFLVGLWWHAVLQPLAEQERLRDFVVAICMFLMALPLEAHTIWNTLKRPTAIILAIFVTFGLLPLVAWAISPWLTADYAGGLLVAAVTPCTMASATVWTRKAGGNDTAATVVTVISNLICFVVTPSWMFLFTGQASSGSWQEFGAMVLKLALIVVLPVMLAQAVRCFALIAEFSRVRKPQLGIASQIMILFMVLIGAIKTGAKLSGAPFDVARLGELLLMIVSVLGLHVLMFWLGMLLARGLGLNRADQIAVGFAGSQKTLMVGMKVSLDQGYSVLPMVTYHIGQLFIDTLLADRLRRTQVDAATTSATK
jgi:solute carrier family 10 (sodium/bile acid cotransporter), member 7